MSRTTYLAYRPYMVRDIFFRMILPNLPDFYALTSKLFKSEVMRSRNFMSPGSGEVRLPGVLKDGIT